MNYRIVTGILIGILIIPVTMIIVSANNLIQFSMDDSQVATASVSPQNLSFYYRDTYISTNTYIFEDSQTHQDINFTQENKARLTWRAFNSTDYELNLTFNEERSPGGYVFINPTNIYDVNASILFLGTSYQITRQNFAPSPAEGIFITYFKLELLQKCPVSVDLQSNNTHNSKYGDRTVSGSIQYTTEIFDPSHNDGLQTLYTILIPISALAMAGLTISGVIIWKRKGAGGTKAPKSLYKHKDIHVSKKDLRELEKRTPAPPPEGGAPIHAAVSSPTKCPACGGDVVNFKCQVCWGKICRGCTHTNLATASICEKCGRSL